MDKSPETTDSRREFLKIVGCSVIALPIVGASACSGEKSEPTAAKPADDPAREPAATSAEAPAARPAAAAQTGASDLPRLSEDDPTAIALGYKHDAADVDTGKFPRRAGPENAEAYCSNCALYVAKEKGQDWAACSIFPGKLVKGTGWCNAYVKAPA